MSLTVKCLLCLDKGIDGVLLTSKLISQSEQEAITNAGHEMVKHMQASHIEQLQQIAGWVAPFNGFNMMKYFKDEAPDSKYEEEKEKMRDALADIIMYAAPEDEEDELEDDEEENDLTDEDEDEDDDDMFEDEDDCEDSEEEDE